MTASKAKKIIREKLNQLGLQYRLTAKTVSFSDLARGDCIFVKIHGWKPNPLWDELDKTAKQNGFCIEFCIES